MKGTFFPVLGIAFSVLLSINFSACTSANYVVPGQNQIKIQNVYNEYFNLAEEYFNLEKYEKAIKYYDLCLSNKKLYNDCFYKKGICYIRLENWKNAAEIFTQLLKKDKNNSTLKASLAYIYTKEGDNTNALNLYKELVEANPQNQEYLENYIAVLFVKENQEEAEKQFETLKELFPESKKIEVIQNKLTELKEAQADSSDNKKADESDDSSAEELEIPLED